MDINEHYVKSDLLYRDAESKTNRDNCFCLVIFAVIFLLCNFLNEIGVFSVVNYVMRVGTIFGMVFCLVPAIVLFRPLCLFRSTQEVLVYKKWYKYLILSFAWLTTATACVTLTHHAVIVMAVPIMIMAQYRNTKKLIHVTVILATLCVLLGVYGGYFYGCFDANLLHIGVTDENVADLAMRAQLATPERMYKLLTHYAIGRELVVLALILLASRISKRSNEMLRLQAEFQAIAEREMQKKNAIQWQIIDGMANLIENRDTSTGEHVKRTSFYVRGIVGALQKGTPYQKELTTRRAETIVRAAPLHDIGKIVISDMILQKPGRLTPEEYEEIKLHAAEGARIIKSVLGGVEDASFIAAAIDIAGGHHERWDGEGYPQGLKENEIPLSARIMAVADVFDALVSKRVYKEALSPEDAFLIIESESGKQFDPEIVMAFLSIKPSILSLLQGAS